MEGRDEEEEEEEGEGEEGVHGVERALKKARTEEGASTAPMLLTPFMLEQRSLQFTKAIGARPWLDPSERARDEFKRLSLVRCTVCRGVLSATNLSNLDKHLGTTKHKLADAATVNTPQLNPAAFAAPPAESGEMKKRLARVRLLTTARLESEGIPKSKFGFLTTGSFAKAVVALKAFDVGTGVAGTTVNDMRQAEDVLLDVIAEKIKGTVGALVFDGAGSKFPFAEGSSVHGIVYAYSGGPPIFLGAIVGSEGSAEGWAEDIISTCERIGLDIPSQVVAGMGDNVSVNDRLCIILGIPRGKCASHIFHLVVDDAAACLPLARELMTTNKRVLKAGGSDRRRKTLGAAPFGIKMSHVNIYTNRWGSAFKVAKYLVCGRTDALDDDVAEGAGAGAGAEGSASFQPWMALHAFYNDLEADADDSADITRMKELLANTECQLQTLLFVELMADVCAVLVQCEADGDNYPADLLDRLVGLRPMLETATEIPATLVDGALQKLEASTLPAHGLSRNVLTALKKRVATSVEASSKAALEKYDKHVPSYLEVTGRKFMYDPRREPRAPQLGQLYNREYFGCLPSAFGLKLVSEWKTYIGAWQTIPEAHKRAGATAFWQMASTVSAYPTLAPVARWWSQLCLSSVAIERKFGVMRTLEEDLRMSMSLQTFKAVMMAACNRPIIEEALAAALRRVS
jgi:hypothetical protein